MKVLRPRESRQRAAVTVVIPCYNYGSFLPHVVASVLDQERVDAKVIIVDDASLDDSVAIAHRLAAGDSRIAVVEHPRNLGHIQTYNDGLHRVETPYCALLSADDLLTPGALARATDLLAFRPEVGMVYGRPLEFSDPQSLPASSGRSLNSWTIWRGEEWIGWSCRRGRCFILSPEVVMRTDAMREVGDYNPELPHSGDLEYWLRTAARWDIGRINGPGQALYRVHGANMHLVSYGAITSDLVERMAAFRTLDSPNGPRDRNRGESAFRRARRAIAREALVLAERELDSGGSWKAAAALECVAKDAYVAIENGIRYRRYRRRLQRAMAGNQPAVAQHLTEFFRSQLNRVRWKLWKEVGIS